MKCVYICVILSFIVFMVSVGFKTSGRCLLKGGKYVMVATFTIFQLSKTRLKTRVAADYRTGLNINNYAALESWRSF